MIEPLRPGRDPSHVGSFRLLARLGDGGFGTVYVARRWDGFGELAAVKVANYEHAESAEFRSRFPKEILAIERVRSEYVPRLIDKGADDERPWLATELVHGPSLARVVHRCGALPEPTVWQLGAAIAEASRLSTMPGWCTVISSRQT